MPQIPDAYQVTVRWVSMGVHLKNLCRWRELQLQQEEDCLTSKGETEMQCLAGAFEVQRSRVSCVTGCVCMRHAMRHA